MNPLERSVNFSTSINHAPYIKQAAERDPRSSNPDEILGISSPILARAKTPASPA
jgi:hypothetical protein